MGRMQVQKRIISAVPDVYTLLKAETMYMVIGIHCRRNEIL